MAKDQDLDEAHRQMTQGQQAGGRSDRGPEINAPGEPQVPTPPYDRSQSDEVQSDAESGMHKAFDADNAPDPGPEPPTSKEERDAPSPTDTTGETPLGVGASRTTGGEEMTDKEGKEAGRKDAGTKGPAGRPVGVSTDEDSTGVKPGGKATDSPNMPSGDQGG